MIRRSREKESAEKSTRYASLPSPTLKAKPRRLVRGNKSPIWIDFKGFWGSTWRNLLGLVVKKYLYEGSVITRRHPVKCPRL